MLETVPRDSHPPVPGDSSPPTDRGSLVAIDEQLLLADLKRRVEALQGRMRQVETRYAERLHRMDPQRRASARNLLHYVSLRQEDLRGLQDQLARLGLSSLGRCEANVMGTLNAVVNALAHLCGQPQERSAEPEIGFAASRDLLACGARDLFGELPAAGGAHIMVTLPSESAHDRALVSHLVTLGVSCVRINCAHDSPAIWERMIAHVRSVSQEEGRTCRVMMDLAGPKLRTGPMQDGPRVLKWKPSRDVLGAIVSPALVWFYNQEDPQPPPRPVDAQAPVAEPQFEELQSGDAFRVEDVRGRRRQLRIVERTAAGVLATSDQTAYVTPGAPMRWRSPGGKWRKAGRLGELPPTEICLVLRPGDRLVLGDAQHAGGLAAYDADGRLIRPATIGCTLPEALRQIRTGDRVLFDDGRIAARTVEGDGSHVELEIVHADPRGTRLKADKGVNLPDTDLQLEVLTPKDLADLQFVAEHADMVAYSFVRRAEDIERLQAELRQLGRPDLPIVLKIENRQAFEQLPSLLLSALRSPACGVMIARGDLAVELGWQRLAEVQEEILWMCEAAHTPVIWATQVLESLAKTGLPSRAEITDAAMSVRAECVMLNKGPHILQAVGVLSDILRRMQDHQLKKRPLLRRLRLADDLTTGS